MILTVCCSVGVTSEMSANSAGRRSQRSVKRPNSDLYIHDDRELDNVSVKV